MKFVYNDGPVGFPNPKKTLPEMIEDFPETNIEDWFWKYWCSTGNIFK